MAKTILVDFDTERSRDFEEIRPIGILLERGDRPGFDSQYLQSVTDDEDETGHDNYVRTMEATELFRELWDKGDTLEGIGGETSVAQLFTYLADNSYLGLRLRSLGMVDDAVTLQAAFEMYVVNGEPLPVMSDEEFPVDV